MKLQLGGLLVAAAVAFAPAANAATFVFSFTGSGGTETGSGDGNTRAYTVSGLKVTASGWTNDTDGAGSDRIYDANLGFYSGNGLGVSNMDDNNNNGQNEHTVDNFDGETDFIVLKFDQDVELTSALFNIYDVTDDSYYNENNNPDGDATVYFKNGAALPTDGMLTSTYFAPLSSINLPWLTSDQTADPRTVSTTGNYSNYWVVSAAAGQSNDGFKLAGVTVNTKTVGGVPEPATWAMMIGGFFGAGAMVRRRRGSFAAA